MPLPRHRPFLSLFRLGANRRPPSGQYVLAAPAIFVAATLPGCASPSQPIAPTDLATPFNLSVSALSAPLTVGETRQLSATATLSGGVQKDATAVVAWQSSNAAVATVDIHGRLVATGVGESDVTAAYKSISGSAHVVVHSMPTRPLGPTYSISAVVHESAPTENVVISNARIEVVNGPLDGQVFTADASGRFVLHDVSEPGFALKFKHPGYDDVQFNVVQLPRDTSANISLPPTLRIVQEAQSGVFQPSECLSFIPYPCMRDFARFAVHHAGRIEIQACQFSGFEDYYARLFRENSATPIAEAVCAFSDGSWTYGLGGADAWVVEAGLVYSVRGFGDRGTPYRLAFTHPN
jgi:hypothetical protein